MIKNIKNFIKTILKYFNVGIIKHNTLKKLLRNQLARHNVENLKNVSAKFDLEMLLTFPIEKITLILKWLEKSKSETRQDLFVLEQLNFKRGGFFVEFGATNGIDISNTYLLEKEFGWSGILAEPAKCWHSDLKKNRNCNIETLCVWKDSNSVISFRETNISELSTINIYYDKDTHKKNRAEKKIYNVNTISLKNLLDKYNAPKIIDYLSIDTEGSEFEIICEFPFSKYSFRVITCEHNFTSTKDKIFNLLTKNGYKRVYENLSRQDDWYVNITI
jgi:FkbM family methyltransferase